MSGGCSGGTVRLTRHARAPPKFFESVMHCDLPDGVVNATSSPNCVAAPSRVAVWNWVTSAGWPDSTNAITSPIGAPGSGGFGGVVAVVVMVVDGVDAVGLDGADKTGFVCSASPPTP